jgi:hypothetical protein
MHISVLTDKLGSILSRSRFFLAVGVIAVSALAEAKTATMDTSECALHLTSTYQAQLEQYLKWNEQANGVLWRETTDFFKLDAASIDLHNVTVKTAVDLNPAIADSMGLSTGHLLAPKHPYNTDSSVAFFNLPTVSHWPARFMASRSVIIWPEGGTPFSIKSGTNFPHLSTEEGKKINMKDNIRIGLSRSDLVRRVDLETNPAKYVGTLREVLAVTDSRGEGYLVRDLTPLLDGHYYLPAFAIPFVGTEIAEKFGESFGQFWGEHYAKALGRAKAEFLLRYKIQFFEANAQNIIVQLDSNLMPTGKIIFQDLGDTNLVTPLTKTPEWQAAVQEAYLHGVPPKNNLNIDWFNSQWQMDQGGLTLAVSRRWENLHNQSYVDELSIEIGPLPKPRVGPSVIPGYMAAPDIRSQLSAIEVYLSSPAGQAALAAHDIKIRNRP